MKQQPMLKTKPTTKTFSSCVFTLFFLCHHHDHQWFIMATVTTQASAAIFGPCGLKSRFLGGSSGKLNRGVAFRPVGCSPSASFKVEAKKGEWLPGLASPGYLTGRYVNLSILQHNETLTQTLVSNHMFPIVAQGILNLTLKP